MNPRIILTKQSRCINLDPTPPSPHPRIFYPTTEAIQEKVKILSIEKIERSTQIRVCQIMSRVADDIRISFSFCILRNHPHTSRYSDIGPLLNRLCRGTIYHTLMCEVYISLRPTFHFTSLSLEELGLSHSASL